jgi:hypothetical protein
MSVAVLNSNKGVRCLQFSSFLLDAKSKDIKDAKGIKGANLKELRRKIEDLRDLVEERWHNLEEEERNSLLKFSRLVFSPEDVNSQNRVKRWSRLKVNLYLSWASFCGQRKDLIEMAYSCSALADAIAEAHEKDEESLTLQYLDFLMKDIENPTKLNPYTIELDAELNELLSGVEID